MGRVFFLGGGLMGGIKVPQQDFALKMQGGGAYVRGEAYLWDTTVITTTVQTTILLQPRLLYFPLLVYSASIRRRFLFLSIQWRLFDAVSSAHSLSVQLSAVETSCTTQKALVLACWPLSINICMRLCVCSVYTSHSYYSRAVVFRSELLIVWLLFEGDDYIKEIR